MSARIRLTAKTAVSATAITATRIVIGRRSAARINHMVNDLPRTDERAPRKDARLPCATASRQERPPHVDSRELVLHFGLREQALRVGDFDDAREARLIAGARLRFALLRGRELHRRVRRDGPRRLHHRRSRLLLTRDRQQRFVVPSASRPVPTPPRQPCGRAGSRSRTGWERRPARRPPSSRDRGPDHRRRRRARRSGFAPLPRAKTLDCRYTRGRSVRASTSSCARATSTAAWRTCASGCAVGAAPRRIRWRQTGPADSPRQW